MTDQPTDPPNSDGDAAHESLSAALAAHGIDLPEDQVEMLDAYRDALWSWNEKLNLTRHTTLEKYVTRDLVDTLELSKLLSEGQRVLDVGSGGGVPGLPLSILRPDLRVSVCESVAKKANVLQAMVEDLGLRVRVYAARVEQVIDPKAGAEKFDTLIARAVAPMWKILFWLRLHKTCFSQLLLIKGPNWVAERGEARHRGVMHGFELRKTVEYTTPRTDAVSTVLTITASEKIKSNERGKGRKR